MSLFVQQQVGEDDGGVVQSEREDKREKGMELGQVLDRVPRMLTS